MLLYYVIFDYELHVFMLERVVHLKIIYTRIICSVMGGGAKIKHMKCISLSYVK